MNPFTTLPAGLKVLGEIRRYNMLAPKIDKEFAEGRAEDARETMRIGMVQFADNVIEKLGLDYTVEGRENIPEGVPLLVMANHQGYCDIVALYRAIRSFHFGLVAKASLGKFPPIKKAVEHTGSLFLDRGNPKDAMKLIKKAKTLFDSGDSLGIFPEGRRSREYKMGEFKAGSFKFAEKGGVPILPVSISGSYHIYEEHGSFRRTPQLVRIHPIVHYEKLTRQEHADARIAIEETIRSGIEDI